MATDDTARTDRTRRANATLYRHPLWIVGRIVDVLFSLVVLGAIAGAIVWLNNDTNALWPALVWPIAVAVLLRWWGNKFNKLAREGVLTERTVGDC
ncbi:hypothetical protein SAMN04488550_1005 [Gordonia malaquae]|uniref:Uncharacterized protein n=1 Tax=Gordonia malaquae NBRC 108250 TaxID=1223542 RepID=M3TFL2_GORML|nr:hypothetical protein [Gordonia malaquae]GAC80231.1 hypothetical protein GM1_015_01070 [Gordonia malaquae NBRC 108250]SEB91204.1 hypothetical protein SAMN04488550_1005 [Gordonia malaquae]